MATVAATRRLIKGFVIVLGAGLTVYFAWRGV
jgi:hypothetical protein